MSSETNCILITGAPGVGKTTLIKELCEVLKKRGIEILGFYTEELHNDERQRIGYDIVTFIDDKRRMPLARKTQLVNQTGCVNMANYTVYIDKFEQLALPALNVFPIKPKQLVVVDEIGKMECKSRKFCKAIKVLSDTVPMLATAPFYTKVPLDAVEHIKNSSHSKVICLHSQDHEDPYSDCLQLLERMFGLE